MLLPTPVVFSLFLSFAQCRPNASVPPQPRRRNPRSLWGNFNDSLIEGITVNEIRNSGVATTFDFVIVGGGPGGLTLALRLTEDPTVRVAVVEKGTLSKASFTFQLGELATSTFVDPTNPALMPSIDYIDVTEPIKANGYRQHYPQGKMLGGSSARGFSAYTRGTRGAFQKWADAVDDQSYAWDNFFPYLQKSVQFTPPNVTLRGFNSSDIMFDSSSFSPTGGPLQAGFANYVSPLATWMKLAWQALGVKPASGFNSGTLEGVQYIPLNINSSDEHRSSADSAMFEASRNRKNLVVFAYTQATMISFNKNKIATGIMASDINNDTFQLQAEREVISCAGVFRSPQLLMVSGIGPAEVLNNLSIPLIADRPGVGQNLQDQSFVGITYEVDFNTTSQIFNTQFADFANSSFSQGLGILTDAVDLSIFEGVPPEFNTSLSPKTQAALSQLPCDWPIYQYLPVNADLLIFRTVESKPPTNTTLAPNYGSLACSISAPFSRGSVSINSASNLNPPVVDIGYLNDERDIELLTIAFKRGRQAWTRPEMKPALIGREYWPGYDLVPDSSDEAIRNHVIQNVMPIWEATSTCKMGTLNDPTAVVDSRARVIGVKGLRVVDASAFPFMLPGHQAATVFGLAERVADLIKADWGQGIDSTSFEA
ncbi:related to choline dehydrogenase [Phialocephala subalpina]|uniref:Related to choline dehydrogenase n=1 Tax=Phialocephala subalpina TaxID=576137 RepID=A0A1L7X0T9_9HELO|nr:related to choline dehydrogenase [Phialocephala subalpina]